VARLSAAAEEVAATHDLSRRIDPGGGDELGRLAESFNSMLTALEAGAEPEDQPPSRLRLDRLVETAVDRAEARSPSVRFRLDTSPCTVSGVEPALERAIGNLLDNAAKWSPANGTVEVSVSAEGEVSVRDHGPGIDAEDLPYVFDRFYRSTAARNLPGSGLGLAIVRQIVEAQGGRVEAESHPAGGAVLRLRLPAVEAPEPVAVA
jgi:two-component system sensor histidine kinase MprB